MYQVYALKYGERDTTACNFFFRETSHEPITLHFFVWLVLGGPHPVLVDAGCREEHTAARGLRGFVSPAALVERVGVKADQIPLVVVSHRLSAVARADHFVLLEGGRVSAQGERAEIPSLRETILRLYGSRFDEELGARGARASAAGGEA